MAAAVAETATKPRDGTRNRRATNIGGPFFVPTDPDHGPSVSDLLTALCPKIQTRLNDALSHLKSSSVSPRQDPFVGYVARDFAFDGLRADPRWDAFLRKAGLPKIEIPDPSSTP